MFKGLAHSGLWRGNNFGGEETVTEGFFIIVFVFFLQTGPKGVIQDYRRYKQLETEQRKEKEKEMKKLAEKFSVSCQSSVSWLVFII